MSGRTRVFVATSLDGFIAGPDDDLSWLPTPSGDPPPDYGFAGFLAGVGALLMGRNTFEVAAAYSGPWPYGERPVLVATHRELGVDKPNVHPISGSIDALLAQAHAAAGDRDVYLDGGTLIRQALDAALIDTVTITLVPVVLGAGSPLFAGVSRRALFEFVGSEALGDGLLQIDYRRRAPPSRPELRERTCSASLRRRRRVRSGR